MILLHEVVILVIGPIDKFGVNGSVKMVIQDVLLQIFHLCDLFIMGRLHIP